MTPSAKMQKYLFKANAVALQGSIRKPYFQELGDHLAITTYAGSAGTAECNRRGFAVGQEISYDSAHTSIAATENNGVCTTITVAQVMGLRIGKLIQVDEVTATLHSIYNGAEYPKGCYPRILPAGSTIRNLRIDGKLQDLKLNPAFGAKMDDEFLSGRRDQDTAYQPGLFPPAIRDPRIGTIYYGEWTWVHPTERHQQRLTMLRLALGCDMGGSIDVGVCASDGVGWPPVNS